MKKNKKLNRANPHFEFNINTGNIYTQLCNKWDELPREIFEQMEWKLKTILSQQKLITVPFSRKMKKYLDGQKKALKSVQEESMDLNNPPFTGYFVHPHGNAGFDLIAYNENCILEYAKDEDFDFFFALKLIALDLINVEKFLDYQFEINFNSNSKDYKRFLKAILLKYKPWVKLYPIAKIVNSFIENELNGSENRELSEKKLKAKSKNIETNELPIEEIPEVKLPETKNVLKTFLSGETNNPDHLTVKQASEFLDIAEQTIYGYTHRKQIPFYKPHKKLYFLKSELEEWLRQGKQGIKTKIEIKIKSPKRF